MSNTPPTPREFAQTLKGHLAIEMIIGEYVPSLVRAGNSYKGLCPFHKEKTPSFHVNPEHGFYHCFGCHAQGDVIKFVMEVEKTDFMTALESLARRAGVPLPRFSPGEDRSPDEEKRLQQLRELCTWAETFFIRQLKEHPRGGRARDYLVGRGLTDELIVQYRLGYAPDGYEILLREAERKGWKGETVAEAGLASRKDNGGFIDRFRDRVIFPIADKNGQVVAFAGRILEKLDDVAKYINSAETPLFKKSRLLYGISAAREAIRAEDRVILMEGYMDWIAMHRRGIRNVLAGMGTALTEEQAQLVRRMTRNVTLLYDGDEPGQKAMARSTELLLRLGVDVRSATLPAEHDPDTFLDAQGVQAMRDKLSQAPGAVDYLLEKIAQSSNLTRPEGKAEAVGRLAPLLLAIEDPVLREGYSARAAGRLGLRLETLEATLRRRTARRPEAQPGEPPPEEAEAPGKEPSRTEQNLLYILLQNKSQWNLLQAVDPEWFQSGPLKTLFEKVYEVQKDVREGGDPPESLFSMCENDQEMVWLSRILMLPTQRFEGEVGGFDRELTSAFQLQIHKLRRQYEERRKRELKQDVDLIRADSPTGTGQLEVIDQLSREIIIRHADLFDRREPDA